MTDELRFSHANIALCIRDTGHYILWDRDNDVFGTGWDFPEALADLAGNYPDEYSAHPDEDD